MKLAATSVVATTPFLATLSADWSTCVTLCTAADLEATSNCMSSLGDCSGAPTAEEYLQCMDELEQAAMDCLAEGMAAYSSCMETCC